MYKFIFYTSQIAYLIDFEEMNSETMKKKMEYEFFKPKPISKFAPKTEQGGSPLLLR